MRITRKNIVAVARAQGCDTKPFSNTLLISRKTPYAEALMKDDGSFIGHRTIASVVAHLGLDADRGDASWAAY